MRSRAWTWGLCIAVLLPAVGVLAVRIGGAGGADERGVGPAPSTGTAHALGGANAESGRGDGLRRSAEPTSSDPKEVGNPTLLAFYGDRAEEAQRALREHGIDPDQLRPLPEWDSVRGRLEDDMRMDADHVATATEALVDWTEELDEEFLEERFGFTGVVDAILLGDVADIADPINLEISVRAADALGRIDRCLEDKFHGEGFQRAPYKIVLDERAQGARLHTGQAMLGGWAVAWDVQREECPGVQESLVECRRLAAQRDREIARLLGDSR